MEQRIIDRSHVGEVLQRIYSSELKIRLTLFSEGGYFYIGHNDMKTPLRGTTVEESATHLATKLAKEFPDSEFAYWWTNNFATDKPT